MPDTPPKVLVTEPEFRKAHPSFVAATAVQCEPAPEDENDLARAIRGSDSRYVIVGNRKYSGALYDALPSGGVIARLGVGHDGIDKERATKAGLLCTNTPGVLDQSVAEHTMLLIVAAARRLIPALANMASGAWTTTAGQDVYGKTLAIIGCGGIGRAVARMAHVGYGMRVIGCTRPDAPAPATLEHFQAVTNDFSAAVRHADFVSLHMPANRDNLGFINRDRLACLNKTTWLINTARGAVIDEAALFESLAAGTLAGAALDVFTCEPYKPAEGSGDLRSLPNVVLTPHVGSNTVEANRRMAERALQNIILAVGRDFDRMDLLNRQVLATS
jgi:phosphoglycerate dehydrogenase-like enzyme